MKNMLKMGLILAAFATVACVGLAFVYRATAPAIAAAQNSKINASLKEIFPDATSFEDVTSTYFDGTQPVKFEKVYLAKQGDKSLGLIVQATGSTYSTATMLVGVDMDRKVQGIKFLQLTDTPGLGSRAAEPEFYEQLENKSVDDPFTVGTDINGLSGATITSKGVANITKYSGYVASEYLAKEHGGRAGTGAAPVIEVPTEMVYDVALKSIYPDAEFEDISGSIENTVDRSILFLREELVKRDGKVVGVIIEAKGPTYKSTTIVVGVNTDRTIAGVRIVEIKDTKNIGTRALEPDFWRQYTDMSVDAPMLVREDVDVMTGATVTTAGITNMVKVAGYLGANYLAEKFGGFPAPAGSASFKLNVVDPEM